METIAQKIKKMQALAKMQAGGMVPQQYTDPYFTMAYQQDPNFNPNLQQIQPSANPQLGNYDPYFQRPQVEALNAQPFGLNLQNLQPQAQTIEQLNTVNPNIQTNTTTNFQTYNPYGGVNIESALFSLGQSLGYQGEQKGWNTARGIASAGKIGLGGARTLLSGAGYQKSNQATQEEYISQLYNSQQPYQTLQEGGTINNAQVLTGAFLPETSGIATAELEKNELVHNSETGEIQKVVGDTHEQGGVDVNLPEGSRVLSDHTKIGAAKAKQFRNDFDLKVKATDTFAGVLDKYNKKIGFTELIEEEEKAIKQVGEQEENEVQTDTKDINMNYLSTRLQELQADKEAMKPLQDEAFNTIFAAQEKTPKKETEGNKMQMGGTITQYDDNITAIAQQYNITPEKVMELMQQNMPQMQAGGTFNLFTPSPYAAEPYAKQTFLPGTTNAAGIATQEDVLARLQYQNQQLPYIVSQSGIYSDNAGAFPNLNNTGAFQASYDNYVNATIPAIEANPYLTAEQKATAKTAAQSQILNISNKDGQYDNVYGQETSSRTGFALPYLTEADKQKYNDIRFLGDVVDETGVIKPEYADLDPETKRLLQETYKRGGNDILNLGLGVVPTATGNVSMTPEQQTLQLNQQNTQLSVPNLPVDFILPPSAATPVYKASVDLGELDPTKVSIEANLVEADRQRQSATDSLSFLPDSQRAAAIASILGQTQTATNQAINQAETANAQSQQQVNQFNLQQNDKQQLLNQQFALDYENRVLRGQTNSERDLRMYFNELNDVNRFNFNYVDRRNLYNQAPTSYKFTQNGIEFVDQGGNLVNPPTSNTGINTAKEAAEYKKKYLAAKAVMDAKKAK